MSSKFYLLRGYNSTVLTCKDLVIYNCIMLIHKRKFFWFIVTLGIGIFLLFIIPNSRASENRPMVQIFEPDEAFPLEYTLRMIAPADSIESAIRQFIFYQYYFYGFPHFGYSAALLIPLKMLGKIENTSLVMLILRQGTSVLLMIAALVLMVYIQDKFTSYRSVVLFLLLALIPAVVQNNFWWHPDSMVTLLSILTLFFLERDRLRLGHNFIVAAILCGVSTAVKNVGAYFFLAVGLVLILSWLKNKTPLRKIIWISMSFVGIMIISYVISNPFLFSKWGRLEYQIVFNKQTALLVEGYGIRYAKGLQASWPTMREYYGEAFFLLISCGALLGGIRDRSKQLLYTLILAWLIPISTTVLFITHFKYQYWLPVAIPLLSCLYVLFPEKPTELIKNFSLKNLVHIGLLLLVLTQAGLFLLNDIHRFIERTNRAENHPAINFYKKTEEIIQPLAGRSLSIYYDTRMYILPRENWSTETSFDLLEYQYIQEKNFDVLLLMQQRIYDYLQESAVGIDPEGFQRSQKFYRDANYGNIKGYWLAYRDNFGLIFIRDIYKDWLFQ